MFSWLNKFFSKNKKVSDVFDSETFSVEQQNSDLTAIYNSLFSRKSSSEILSAKKQDCLGHDNVIFSAYGIGMSESESKSFISKLNYGGYIEELRGRLSDIGISLSINLNVSQIYEEALSGNRYRVVFTASSASKKLNEDLMDEIEYMFQDIFDDFSELGFKLRIN